jgi:hypothetical protein
MSDKVTVRLKDNQPTVAIAGPKYSMVLMPGVEFQVDRKFYLSILMPLVDLVVPDSPKKRVRKIKVSTEI